jgi:hypothetical protein
MTLADHQAGQIIFNEERRMITRKPFPLEVPPFTTTTIASNVHPSRRVPAYRVLYGKRTFIGFYERTDALIGIKEIRFEGEAVGSGGILEVRVVWD